jgi:2-phosphosulfolactate phosphatase
MPTIEVSLSPVLYKHMLTREHFGVAVIDVLRATTSITTAFDFGVKEIFPVATDEEAVACRAKGCLIAAENDGITLDYADFGNSPFYFRNTELKGTSIAYKTTNGTQTIKMLERSDRVIIASFLNLTAVVNWFQRYRLNAVLLCSGWKNKFNLEDSLLAGALVEKLEQLPDYRIECDAAHAVKDLWLIAKNDPVAYIQKAMHRERLRKLGLDDVIDYCFTIDISDVMPEFDGDKIVDVQNF